MDTVIIGMAEIGVVKSPQKISTLGLGSCVGVVLYDKISKLGGMVHIVLPDSKNQINVNKAKFADIGIDELLNKMLQAGANRSCLIAKIAGGAHMFGGMNKNDMLKVGERNAVSSKASLHKLKIPIVAEDLGGSCGRTIELNTEDGTLRIKVIGKTEKYL